jgi:hypothetical protein
MQTFQQSLDCLKLLRYALAWSCAHGGLDVGWGTGSGLAGLSRPPACLQLWICCQVVVETDQNGFLEVVRHAAATAVVLLLTQSCTGV